MQGMTDAEIKAALTAPLFTRESDPLVGQHVTCIIDGVRHDFQCQSFIVQDVHEGLNFMDARRAQLAASKSANTTPAA